MLKEMDMDTASKWVAVIRRLAAITRTVDATTEWTVVLAVSTPKAENADLLDSYSVV